MAQLHGLRVGEADDRRRMEPHADHETCREMLMDGLGDQQRRAILRGRPGRETALLEEIALEFGRIDALAADIVGALWVRR